MRQKIIDLITQYDFKATDTGSMCFGSAIGYVEIGRYTVRYLITGIAAARIRLGRFRKADLKHLEDLILRAQILAAFR